MNDSSTKKEFKKANMRHERSQAKMEELRTKSRQVRKELIDAILCDAKDVLSRRDVAAVHKALKKFLAVQRRLGKAFFNNANTFGALLWAADGRPADEEP